MALLVRNLGSCALLGSCASFVVRAATSKTSPEEATATPTPAATTQSASTVLLLITNNITNNITQNTKRYNTSNVCCS